MVTGTDVGQAYLQWLAGRLGIDLGATPPQTILDAVEGGRQWYRADYPVQWDTWVRGYQAIMAGDFYSAPYFYTEPTPGEPSFYEMFMMSQKVQQTYTPAWQQDAERIGDLDLYRLSDGTYVDSSGVTVPSNYVAIMIKDWLADMQAGGQTDLTAYQKAQLDLAMQDLAWEQQQYSTLSAWQSAQLGQQSQQMQAEYALGQAQIEQQYREWLAGLQASPANWIERWYAEHLSPGAEPFSLMSEQIRPPQFTPLTYQDQGQQPNIPDWYSEWLTAQEKMEGERAAREAAAQQQAFLTQWGISNLPAGYTVDVGAGTVTSPGGGWYAPATGVVSGGGIASQVGGAGAGFSYSGSAPGWGGYSPGMYGGTGAWSAAYGQR